MIIRELEPQVHPIWITLCRVVSLDTIQRLKAIISDVDEIQYKFMYIDDTDRVEFVAVKISGPVYTFYWKMGTFTWRLFREETLDKQPFHDKLRWQKEGF